MGYICIRQSTSICVILHINSKLAMYVASYYQSTIINIVIYTYTYIKVLELGMICYLRRLRLLLIVSIDFIKIYEIKFHEFANC